MTEEPLMKLISDHFQRCNDDIDQYKNSVEESLQPVHDALNSCPENLTIDAYDAIDEAKRHLFMAYLIMGWERFNPELFDLSIEEILLRFLSR